MKLFLLNLNCGEVGPFTEKQLRSMWQAGTVTANTEWRQTTDDSWFSGENLPAWLEGSDQPSGLIVLGHQEVQHWVALRERTAYPFARRLIPVLVYILFVGMAASWIVVFIVDSDSRASFIILAVAITLSSLVYFAVALLGQALLDLADLAFQRK